MNNIFTSNLKKLREKQDLTRKDVAQYLDIHESTYGKYELGHREPSIEIIKKLAELFNISTDYLLGKTNKTDTEKEKKLIIPNDLKDIKVAFHHGEDGLTQDEVDKIAEYVRFIKSQRKDK